MRRWSTIALGCLLVGAALGSGAAAAPNTEGGSVFTKERILTLMRAVHAYQLAHPWAPKDRNWIRGTYYTGVMALYQATHDEGILAQAERWAEENAWAEGTESLPANKMTCGQTYLELYFLKPDPSRLARIRAYADTQIARNLPGRKAWDYCDALYVAPPTYAMLAKATGERKYRDYLNRIYWDVIRALLDKDAGLVYRDARYRAQRTANGKKVFWSRGNGWVLGGIPRVLGYLPQDDPSYPRYVALFCTLAASVARAQGGDGLWRANLADVEEYPGPETSGSAFFCYALAWGINHALLPRAEYLPVVQKAWEGLARCVQPNGKLGYVQPVGDSPQPAPRDSTHEYAMGAFLLAGSEMLRLVADGGAPDPAACFLPPAVTRARGAVPASAHPLGGQINAFLRRQAAFKPFQPTGLTRADYLRIIAGEVRAMRAYQDPQGRIIDPVMKTEAYYATPCYAHSVAAVVAGGFDNDPALLESGMKAMDSAVSTMARGVAPMNHGDFFTYPVMLAFDLYGKLAPPERVAHWRELLAKVEPGKLYQAGPGSANWNVVNLAGEFLRARAGLTSMAYTEASLASQLGSFTELGMYHEHGDPLPYDHFPRHFLGGMLHLGYRGDSYLACRDLLWRGAWTSLFIQSPFGELPTGYRSSQHIWNEAESAVTYEVYAAESARAGRAADAGAFKRAAHLSLECIRRWIRPDGTGYIVKNRYPIEARHGYEGYSEHTNYNLLACSMLAAAWQFADDSVTERPAPADVGGFVVPILSRFHKVFANAGGTYVEYDTCGDHIYNPTGILRVHVKGGHPQLGPSDGCAPKYSGPGVNLAVGPAWQDEEGIWHRLAELSPEPPRVELEEDTPARVRFRVVYDALAGAARVEDASGAGQHAALRGGSRVPGRGREALSFAGPQTVLTSTRPLDFARGDYTLALWVRPSGAREQQDLLAATTEGRHALLLETDGGRLRFLERFPPGTAGGTDLYSEPGKLEAGRWHHIAAVRRGAELALFIDGRPAGTGRSKARFTQPLQVIAGALYPDGAERHFTGEMDEVRLYHRALSPQEIGALAAGQESDPTAKEGLAARWLLGPTTLPTKTALTERITVDPAGVTVEDEVTGSGIRALRVSYPMLVFDGLKETEVRLEGASVSLRLDGRGVRFTLLEPKGVRLQRSGTRVGHRNGMVEAAFAEFAGRRAAYRIEALPGREQPK